MHWNVFDGEKPSIPVVGYLGILGLVFIAPLSFEKVFFSMTPNELPADDPMIVQDEIRRHGDNPQIDTE